MSFAEDTAMPNPSSPIEEQLNNNRHMQSRVYEAMEKLLDRLKPIMIATIPPPATNQLGVGDNKPAYSCDLERDLANLCNRTNDTFDAINSILSRLAI